MDIPPPLRPPDPDHPTSPGIPPPVQPLYADVDLTRQHPPHPTSEWSPEELITRPKPTPMPGLALPGSQLGPAEQPAEEGAPRYEQGAAEQPRENELTRGVGEVAITGPLPREVPEEVDSEALKALARERVGFHFVRAEHELLNAEAVAENLTAAGCQTVAFELVGATDEQRAELEAAMQDYHNRELAPEVRDEAGDKLLFASLGYIKGVIDHLTPTVERLRLFDMSADHPDYAKVVTADECDTATAMAMGTYKPNAVQRILLVDMLEAYADESIVREPLMAEQLVDLAVAEARLEPHTIGAVAGPAHVGHHQRVSAEGFTCTTSPILYTEGPATGAQFVVSLVQQLISNRAQPLDPLQVDRAHVELIGRHNRLDPAEAAALASRLPDDQLAPLLRVLDAAKQPGRPPEDIVIGTRAILRQAYKQFVKGQV